MVDKEEISKELDEDIYNKDFREELMDNDEITPAEEGFMQGYEI